MIVVGSGAIGVEFAYFYATMGTKSDCGRIYAKYCS